MGLGPVFVAKGTVEWDNTAGDITPTFPATVLAGDIAILVHCSDSTTNPTMPGGGWTAEAQQTTTLWNTRMAWLRCTGTEGGTTVAVAQSGAVVKGGQIFLFRHCVETGTPYEDYSGATGISTTAASNATTISGSDRLAVRITANSDDVTGSTPSGFTSPLLDSTLLGGDMSMILDFKSVASAGTENSSSRTITSGAWTVLDFAMIPMASPPSFRFNSANKSSSVTLKDNDKTATQAGGGVSRIAMTTRGHHVGKYVISWDATTVDPNTYSVGIATGLQNLDNFPALGASATSVTWYGDGTVFFNNANQALASVTFDDGNTCVLAVDYDNGTYWRRNGTGNWNANGSADPATNTGGHTIPALTVGARFIAWSSDTANDVITLKATASVPSGFTDLIASRIPLFRRPPYRFFNKGF